MRNHDMVALLARHTARPPATSYARAVRTLETYGTVEPSLIKMRLRPTAEYGDAALAFLTYRFTPLLVTIEDDLFGAAFEAAVRVLQRSEQVVAQRFLDEVVLNFAHPRDHMLFAELLKLTIPTQPLAHALRHHAALGNPLHQHNVFWLVHYLDGVACPVLRAIAERLARPGSNRYLREAAVAALQVARERGAIG